jgi:hypothetical protein
MDELIEARNAMSAPYAQIGNKSLASFCGNVRQRLSNNICGDGVVIIF